MVKTAIAMSPMMRNALNVAMIPLAAVTTTQIARIAPRIVPMIRPMYPVCPRCPGTPTELGLQAPAAVDQGPRGVRRPVRAPEGDAHQPGVDELQIVEEPG